jgi:hypothetical protein
MLYIEPALLTALVPTSAIVAPTTGKMITSAARTKQDTDYSTLIVKQPT